MPGANYMGGKRNAAKARVKDTTSRLEKTFFGQRRLCALSKGLLASKPMQRNNGPREEGLGRADISLSHARQKTPPNSDIITRSFVPSPIHIEPRTPRSRRRTKKKLEAHSSSSNVSRSKVLDALDVSEPMFLRGVLDRILTMPDLAGIAMNRTKHAAGTGRQPQASDESSPPKRKRSVSSLYEKSDSLSDESPSSSSRYMQSHTYDIIRTPLREKHSISDRKIPDKERTRTFMNLLVEDGIFPYRENTSDYDVLTRIDADGMDDSGFSEGSNNVQGDDLSSPWSSQHHESSRYGTSSKRPSSNYTPNPNIDSSELMNWNESHGGLPTCILFRGLKDSSAKRSMTTTTFPDEEPTVYGTLFEQADPWETIGQILGLSNTKPSKSPGDVEHELREADQIEGSRETNSAEVETEEWEEDLNVGPEEIQEIPHPLLRERELIELRCGSLEEFDGLEETENARTAISHSPQLSCLQDDVEEAAQVSENCLSGDIEDKLFSLTPLSQDILEKSPDGIKPGLVQLDVLECDLNERGSMEGVEEYKSVLAIPELKKVDGLFMGPSLFELLLDEDEDEI